MARADEEFKLSAKAAEKMGLPDGYKVYSPFPFGGMDQQSSRIALKDNEFFYRENFIRIGDGNLRTLWDQGLPLYTAPIGKTIVYFFFYNIGIINYAAVFLSDGSAVQINSVTQVQTVISSTLNTFYMAGSSIPVCSQWGALYLLIANNITSNSYWVWDGTTFYQSGGLGPGVTITDGGAGYSSVPAITAFGGSGSEITATATVNDGSVVLVTITNPGMGYLPGDIVQFAFSGGGTDSSSILQAVLVSGTVSSLQLVDAGSGYTDGTYALGFTGGGGTGAAGTYTVTGGIVTALTLSSGGSGYTGSPAISFPSGAGTGAAAIAILGPGGVASVNIINGGSGFTSTPTLTFEGGGGTGAAATVTLTSGVITGVTVTAPGTGYTSDPSIVVETGVNNAAAAMGTLMPFGVSGNSIETFQQRVWLGFPNQTGNQDNGGTILVSAPESITDFASSDGGLTYVSTDPFLRYQYTNLKQSNGYLYPIGDSSVDVISNVNTSGSPPSTTFNYQNTDPQIGTSWRDTCADYSRTILFANPLGVYGLYGGSVTKISAKVDNLFTNAVFPQNGGVTPCAAIANIFSQKIFLLLMTVSDVYTNAARNVMLGWDEKEWFIASQSSTLTFIGNQEVNSNITAWGTDGTTLFPLFNAPSSVLEKSISTKLYGADRGFIVKQAMGLYLQAQDLTKTGTGIDFSTATVDNELGSYTVPNTVQFPALTPTTPLSTPLFSTQTEDVPGVNLGVTLKSSSPDFVLNYLSLGYIDTVGIFGSTNQVGSEEE